MSDRILDLYDAPGICRIPPEPDEQPLCCTSCWELVDEFPSCSECNDPLCERCGVDWGTAVVCPLCRDELMGRAR